jgi:hypothetical protein
MAIHKNHPIHFKFHSCAKTNKASRAIAADSLYFCRLKIRHQKKQHLIGETQNRRKPQV